AGGVVTFSNKTAIPHGVDWVGGPAKPACDSSVPVGTTEAASGTEWSGNCTFYCTVHGPEMTGTVTVSANGTTTVTSTTTPTATTPVTTTPAPKTEAPGGSPFAGTPSLRSSQHGTSVHGSIQVSQAGAGGRLEIDLLAPSATLAKAAHGKHVTVGRFVRSSVKAGSISFAVKLNAKARRALSRRRRLALTVRIVLTPFYGEPTTITRSVLERP